MKKVKYLLWLLLSLPLLAMAAGGGSFPQEKLNGDLTNVESLQRGAKYYVNYCLACHSLKYQRYNRIGMDTGLDDDIIKKNLIFTGAKVGDTMNTALPADSALGWFGKLPPDLSLIARSKGKDYVYNYLNAFYIDESKSTGMNNSVFPDVGMPHVLSGLEGSKIPVYDDEHQIVDFKVVKKGELNETDYNSVVYDLSNFLYYVGDPSKIKRDKLGWKVLLFLLLMTIIFYFLKKEYWKDIH